MFSVLSFRNLVRLLLGLFACALLPALPAKAAEEARRAVHSGVASWYGQQHNGRPTASGEIFDSRLATAAHRRLPLGSRVKVTVLASGRSIVVRINDRGPYVEGRIIDLSERAARELGILAAGVAAVALEVLPRPRPAHAALP